MKRITGIGFLVAGAFGLFGAAPAVASESIGLNANEVTEIMSFTSSGGKLEKGLVQVNAGGGHDESLPNKTLRAWATATLSGKSTATSFMSTRFSVVSGQSGQRQGRVRVELTDLGYRGTLSAAGASTALFNLKMRVSPTVPVSGEPPREITIVQRNVTGLFSTREFTETGLTPRLDIPVTAGRSYDVRVELTVGAGGANLVSTAISDFNNDGKKVNFGPVRVSVVSGGGTSSTAPQVNLTINNGTAPAPVPKGGTATLSWSARNVAQCTASGDWSGDKRAGGGTQVVGPITTNSTYTLTCRNTAGASATKSVQATVFTPGTGSAGEQSGMPGGGGPGTSTRKQI